MEEYLGKSYEAVFVVHDNTAHVHSHIVFNSVSFVDGKKSVSYTHLDVYKRQVELHEGVDADLLMKVLTNPEMAALLTAVAKTMKV